MYKKEDLDLMDMEQLMYYIQDSYHKPLIIYLKKLDKLLALLKKEYVNEYPEIRELLDVYGEFKEGIYEHMTKEDNLSFPAIVAFEKLYYSKEAGQYESIKDMEALVNDSDMNNDHTVCKSLLKSMKKILESNRLNTKDIKGFEKIKSLFLKMFQSMKEHSEIEDNFLYCKGEIIMKKARTINKLEKQSKKHNHHGNATKTILINHASHIYSSKIVELLVKWKDTFEKWKIEEERGQLILEHKKKLEKLYV